MQTGAELYISLISPAYSFEGGDEHREGRLGTLQGRKHSVARTIMVNGLVDKLINLHYIHKI